MSILDDAIREHLELKRAHGADDAELKKLEDEAFGPPARPDEHDPMAEAPTEFLVAPEIGADEAEEEARTRSPNIADLQEGPVLPEPTESVAPPEAPAEEEQPAMEHETIPAPPAKPEPQEIEGGHSTEERHAIAEQPTELFDVEGEFDAAAAGETEAPSEEQLLDAELAEPRLAPVDPLAGIDGGAEAELEISDLRPAEDDVEEDEDDFFSEQRLSDELNQALSTPLPDEPQLSPSSPPTEEATAIFDVEADQEEAVEEDSGEFAQEEDSGEYEVEEDSDAPDDAPLAEQTQEHRVAEPPPAEPSRRDAPHEDLLEDTPDFLEDAPEDDNLWFEQKPPKDFDFDD